MCDLEVRRFNETAAQFEVFRYTQSAWTCPFAQKRWCSAAGVDRVRCLSDYRDHSFGKATGTRIEELGLLTRAVFVADEEGNLVYVEYVPEVAEHPDYEACLNCLKKLPGSCRAVNKGPSGLERVTNADRSPQLVFLEGSRRSFILRLPSSCFLGKFLPVREGENQPLRWRMPYVLKIFERKFYETALTE